MANYELYHHGKKGMKWGVRLYQNKDGSLTPLGRMRYRKAGSDATGEQIKSINTKTAAQIKRIKAQGRAEMKLEKAQARAAAKIAKAEAKYLPKKNVTTDKPKSINNMTDDELRSSIARMRMEKDYRELASSLAPKVEKSKVDRGKQFAAKILEKSAENIATQSVTYLMGAGVNKLFADVFNDPSIVNPKKGQKDK